MQAIWRLRPRNRREALRDFWLLVITGMSLLAIVNAGGAADDAQQAARSALHAQHQQQEGRRLGQAATCAAISAVIDSGRATIVSGSQIGPRDFELALEGLGLPPERIRQRQAERAARLYAQGIASAVERAAHARGIVRSDGSLDCGRLRGLTRLAR